MIGAGGAGLVLIVVTPEKKQLTLKLKIWKMRINRTELLNAIKFLKPAILNGSQSAQTNVHVRIDEGKAILTADNGEIGKRVLLLEPAQMEAIPKESAEGTWIDNELVMIDQEEPRHYEFMIPRSTLEGFETICQKHKNRFKDSPDKSLEIVEITPHFLLSHKDRLEYFQPVCSFPDLDRYFIGSGPLPTMELFVMGETVIDALKEFRGTVRMMLTGNENAVYLSNFDETYQAYFLTMEGNEKV